jgi:hypothetical protein
MIDRACVLAAMAATACGTPVVNPHPVADASASGVPMIDTACAAAIRNLADGRITDARLSPNCTVADATRAIDTLAKARDATGALGSDRVQVRWRAIETGIAGERLRLWHDGEHVLAVEIEAPRPAGGWDDLRAAIGTPDAKLAYWDDVVESKDGQWVYPACGLAVFTTLADTEIARVLAFPPTTIAIYRARLARGMEPPREIEAP